MGKCLPEAMFISFDYTLKYSIEWESKKKKP